MRTLAERLFRNSKLRRRLPNGAIIWVSPDSQLKYLRGSDFDRDLILMAERYVGRGSTVWDIGANCGVFAFSAAHAARVVAVEADPFLCHLLQLSASANPNVHLTIVPGAVSAACGLADFAIAERGRASNYLVEYGGHSQTGGTRGTLLVPTITLDLMFELLPAPTFIKIDVEGAEAGVLRGAKKLMSDARPTIYVEVGRTAADECRAIFDAAAYHITTGHNWLAVPTEKLALPR